MMSMTEGLLEKNAKVLFDGEKYTVLAWNGHVQMIKRENFIKDTEENRQQLIKSAENLETSDRVAKYLANLLGLKCRKEKAPRKRQVQVMVSHNEDDDWDMRGYYEELGIPVDTDGSPIGIGDD